MVSTKSKDKTKSAGRLVHVDFCYSGPCRLPKVFNHQPRGLESRPLLPSKFDQLCRGTARCDHPCTTPGLCNLSERKTSTVNTLPFWVTVLARFGNCTKNKGVRPPQEKKAAACKTLGCRPDKSAHKVVRTR